MPIGGSIESLTLQGRTFSVAADSDSNRKLGGFENEIQANGDGTARLVKTRVPFSITDINVVVDDAKGDHEFLQDLADGNQFFPITITYASGEIYTGEAQISGELVLASQATTATLSLMGTAKLVRQ